MLEQRITFVDEFGKEVSLSVPVGQADQMVEQLELLGYDNVRVHEEA